MASKAGVPIFGRAWYEVAWIRSFFTKVLAFGPLPRHIGFIMDGNRRFAQKKSMEKVMGHTMGFHKLKEVALPSLPACQGTHRALLSHVRRLLSGVLSWG